LGFGFVLLIGIRDETGQRSQHKDKDVTGTQPARAEVSHQVVR
jgi:hypothetical protein